MLKEIREKYYCYLWISPFFIIFVIFQLYPVLSGFFISLTKWDGFSPTPTFVGLSNYTKLVKDSHFWETLLNTLIIWALIVPIRVFLALVIAAIINNPKLKGGSVFSFFFLLPYITAIVVVAIIFRILLTTDGGIVNVFLGNIFGMNPIPWLDSTAWSKPSIAIMNVWRMTGYFVIIMLAGLQGIPRNLYEAAQIDGATKIQTFFKITVPLMSNVIFFAVMISTIWIFQNIGDSMVLTNGGPQYSSTPLVLYIYRNAFEYFKLGYSSALTMVLFLILFITGYLVMKERKKYIEQ